MTQYQPYGVRHLLRNLDAEGASELRVRQVNLRTRAAAHHGRAAANLDDFDLDAVLVYRTLVLGRSPVESRPPAPYQLVWKGRWWEVWQRPETPRQIREHVPLGTDLQPSAVPGCGDVLRLARLAGPAGTLADGGTAFESARLRPVEGGPPVRLDPRWIAGRAPERFGGT